MCFPPFQIFLVKNYPPTSLRKSNKRIKLESIGATTSRNIRFVYSLSLKIIMAKALFNVNI